MVLDYIKNELFDFVHGPNCDTTFDVGDILDLEESVVVFGSSRKGNLIGVGYLIGYKSGETVSYQITCTDDHDITIKTDIGTFIYSSRATIIPTDHKMCQICFYDGLYDEISVDEYEDIYRRVVRPILRDMDEYRDITFQVKP